MHNKYRLNIDSDNEENQNDQKENCTKFNKTYSIGHYSNK